MVKTLSRPVEQEPDLAQLDACRQIIGQHCYSTQEEIRRELSERGFADISQSTISRLLRRLGVAKAQNANGKKVYTLVDEQLEPAGSTRSIHDMVREVVHNQQMVLIHTTPGAATVVARLLDRNANPGSWAPSPATTWCWSPRATSAAPVRPTLPWCAPWPKPANPSHK